MIQKFNVNGMTCGSCRQTVEKSLQGVEGVTSVQVNLSPPEALIEKADRVTLNQLNSALSKAGNYSIGEYQSTTQHKNKGGSCCG
tara:strand:+ start:548 stop:802 length:255 start_codon:yes stop_codon:yes gene_type:complete